MDFGPHAFFIIWSYAVAISVVAGLIAWVVFDEKKQQALLDALDAQGIKRRSSQTDGEGGSR